MPPDRHVEVPLGLALQGPAATDGQFLMALGGVVRAASMLDLSLRTLFCALMGSKYAAITVGGMMTGALIDECDALAKGRTDLDAEAGSHLVAILADARTASSTRNRMVHDLWATGEEGPELLRSQRRSHDLTATRVSLDNLLTTASDLSRLTPRIYHWIQMHLDFEAMSLEAQLRWEAARPAPED